MTQGRSTAAATTTRSVQVELQADCLAGVRGRSADSRSEFSANDLVEALNTADEIGDDYLRSAGGEMPDPSLSRTDPRRSDRLG